MIVDSVITISISYILASMGIIYAQHLTQWLQGLPIDIKYPGFALFLVGLVGNFYHHYLLSQLRAKGDKDYKIPKGGLLIIYLN